MPQTDIPATPVFDTPSATAWHQEIAERNTILKIEVGSTMHGVSNSTTGDDIDEMGICIEPPEVLMGIAQNDAPLFRQYEYRTKAQGERSGVGDVDRIIYSLRKWMRMAAQGQPTQLMPLFAQDEMVRVSTLYGDELRENRAAFISKLSGDRFEGYLQAQIRRYLAGKDGHNVNRPELTEQYGFDTKAAYHALRLAIQGEELMITGRITLPMSPSNRQYLLDVRQGHYPKEAVLDQLQRKVADLKRAQRASHLPETPDYRALSSWCASLYQRHWAAR